MLNKFALAQANPRPGDVLGNIKIAESYILEAKEKGASLVVFSEYFLIGYPYFDLPTAFPKLVESGISHLKDLANSDIAIIIGLLDENLKSSLALIKDGEIKLASSHLFELEGKKVFAFVGECDVPKCDVIVNPVCIQARFGTQEALEERLGAIAKKEKTPLLCVNQAVANDSFSFMGASVCFDDNGKLLARAGSFENGLFFCDKLNDYPKDLEFIYRLVVHSICEYFEKTGFKRAVLGLSGGLDSTVCAALLVEALGAKNVFGVSMPSSITLEQSRSDAKVLAHNLGLNFLEIPIKGIVYATDKSLCEIFSHMENLCEGGRCKAPLTFDNVQARARANILWGIANEFEDTLTIATSDKSELYMGYATINGDMSGGFAPISDIKKTTLFKLAEWINKKNGNPIPQSILEKRPGAELAIDPKTNKPLLAEDALMPYDFLDETIHRHEDLNQDFETMMKEPFEYELEKNISREQKQEWLLKFFRRMQTGLYKWSIMPQGPIIEPKSVNGAEFKLPIVSKFH